MLMIQLEILLIGCGYVIELADERGIISQCKKEICGNPPSFLCCISIVK